MSGATSPRPRVGPPSHAWEHPGALGAASKVSGLPGEPVYDHPGIMKMEDLPGDLQNEWADARMKFHTALELFCLSQERLLVRMAEQGGVEREHRASVHYGISGSPVQDTTSDTVYTRHSMRSCRSRTPGSNIANCANDMQSDEGTIRALQEKVEAEQECLFALRPAPELSRVVNERLDEIQQIERREFLVVIEEFFLIVVGWCLSLREPPRTGRLARFVQSSFWSTLVSTVIFLNAAFMIYTVDWAIDNIGRDHPPLWVDSIERFFVVFFGIELMLRLIVHRLYFLCNDNVKWNIFDLTLVLLAVWDDMSTAILANDQNGNLTFLRSLRILRMVRTLRVIRVLRFASQLRRMLQSLMGSMMSLFWSFALMVFIFYLFSLAAVQGMTAYLQSADAVDLDPDIERFIHQAFGSVFRTMLTFYKATSGGDDWSKYYEPITSTTWMNCALFLFVVGFTQIALLNILTGVFVENAMKLAQPDRNSMALEQRRADVRDAEELRRFLKELDVDCSGTISWDEFSQIAKDPHVKAVLEVMGLEIRDARLFFEMLRKTGNVVEVDFDFLVESCLQMKGPATNIDMQALSFKTQRLSDQIEELSRRMSSGNKAVPATVSTARSSCSPKPHRSMTSGAVPTCQERLATISSPPSQGQPSSPTAGGRGLAVAAATAFAPIGEVVLMRPPPTQKRPL